MTAIEKVVDKMDTGMVILAFFIMSIMAYCNLFKYRK